MHKLRRGRFSSLSDEASGGDVLTYRSRGPEAIEEMKAAGFKVPVMKKTEAYWP